MFNNKRLKVILVLLWYQSFLVRSVLPTYLYAYYFFSIYCNMKSFSCIYVILRLINSTSFSASANLSLIFMMISLFFISGALINKYDLPFWDKILLKYWRSSTNSEIALIFISFSLYAFCSLLLPRLYQLSKLLSNIVLRMFKVALFLAASNN